MIVCSQYGYNGFTELLACSRLRDSGEKGEEKTRAKKRAGAGERQGFLFPPPPPFFPRLPRAYYFRVPLVFAPTPCLRADPTI